MLERLVEGEFRPPSQFMLQRATGSGGHKLLLAPRFAVAERILAGLVEVELVVCVLDERHGQAVGDKARDQLLDQGRLAAARPAGKAEYVPDRHRQCRPRTASINSPLA